MTTSFNSTIISIMNPFNTTRHYKKIFLLFFLVLFLSSLIAPFIKAVLDSLLSTSSSLADILHYEEGQYNFARVMRRIMLLTALFLIFFLRKSFVVDTLAAIGIKPIKGWLDQLKTGIFLSTGMFIFCIIALYISGTQKLETDLKSFGNILFHLLEIMMVAGLVACIEEVFFRGFIFQNLLRDMKVMPAICISSLMYSFLHFFSAKLPVAPGIQPFVGFVVVYHSFASIILKFTTILPSVIGLFCAGIVLSYAFLRTQSLYCSIGLHAGWIFLLKSNKFFFDDVYKKPHWFFGDNEIVTGMLSWCLLLATLILVRFVTKAPYNGKIITGTR
ncbi:MAG: CPBP family intramembrane metalloprotease [Candidatus Brocadiaceae bacterium]|nr:CPBP family intramembrane metalloprotease [Candidatus Brocadiaceae bacterium]